MFLKTFISAMLFTSLLGAAGSNDADIFSVRSFINPKTKEKIPITGRLFGAEEPKLLAAEPRTNDKCAIPLLEFKAKKTNDAIAKLVGPMKTNASLTIPPLLPACEGWVQGQDHTTPPPLIRLR